MLEVNKNTLMDWTNSICEVRTNYVMKNNVITAGNCKVVEIDEAKLIFVDWRGKVNLCGLTRQRKKHKGRIIESTWIFEGVEQKDKSKCFFLSQLKEDLMKLLLWSAIVGSHMHVWRVKDFIIWLSIASITSLIPTQKLSQTISNENEEIYEAKFQNWELNFVVKAVSIESCTASGLTALRNESTLSSIMLVRFILLFKGIDYLRVLFFLLLNLEAWNLACVCKIEIP